MIVCVRQFAMNNGFPPRRLLAVDCTWQWLLFMNRFRRAELAQKSPKICIKHSSLSQRPILPVTRTLVAHNFVSFIRCTHGTKELNTNLFCTKIKMREHLRVAVCFFAACKIALERIRKNNRFDGPQNISTAQSMAEKTTVNVAKKKKWWTSECATRDRKSQTIKVD